MEQELNKKDKYINHYLNDIYTKEEAEQFLQAINNDSKHLDDSIEKVWEESVSLHVSEQEKKQLSQEAHSLIRRQKQNYTISISRQLLKKLATVAAAIAILIVGFNGVKYLTHNSMNPTTITENVTSFGETKMISLPDGTLVNLNSCSQISYPQKFDGDERKIYLKGEAYFQVAKNEKQPFVINTDQFDIKVLGTVFNVKAYEGDEMQTVSVESGKVQIDMPEAMMRLIAKEEINYNTKSNEFNKHREDEKIAIWRDGYFRFMQTPMMDVVRELERTFNCKIKVRNNLSFDNLITGEHPNTNVEDILKSIQYTTGIRYQYDKNANEILLYK